MGTLTIRTDDKLIKELDHLAKLNHTDRATEARKILIEGLVTAKLELALKIYRKGSSIGKAAEQAQINLWDLIEYFPKVGQVKSVNIEDLKQELRNELNTE